MDARGLAGLTRAAGYLVPAPSRPRSMLAFDARRQVDLELRMRQARGLQPAVTQQ